MNNHTLVSIICLCYNHEAFVASAIRSVLDQTYSNIEIIVVDDCSTDKSVEKIKSLIQGYPQIKSLFLNENLGNTRAFNKGLAMSTGTYIIDLAADDILLPKRVEKGLETFNHYSSDYGVNFSNAEIINETSEVTDQFYVTDQTGNAISKPPEGDLYSELIQRFFICPPTMMSRREVFDSLQGYDEALAYEDFDFWVRSARRFRYCYTDDILVQRRRVADSLSSRQYVRDSDQMRSTFTVCQKIKQMNIGAEEDQALKTRIKYEMKQCLKVMNFELFFRYFKFLISL